MASMVASHETSAPSPAAQVTLGAGSGRERNSGTATLIIGFSNTIRLQSQRFKINEGDPANFRNFYLCRMLPTGTLALKLFWMR